MEKLKAAVPDTLSKMVGQSTPDDLPDTCSSLLDFFLHFDPFQQIVADLADASRGLCGKNKEAALNFKQTGNQCFSNGDYTKALDCYTQALKVSPFEAEDMGKNLVATLYINRAIVLHKMNLSRECLRDCTRALQISPTYAKAWYRRGKTNASLGNHEDAICDLRLAKIYESSISGKKQVETELEIISDQRSSTSPVIQPDEIELPAVGEPLLAELQCVTAPDKGRGMVSTSDFQPASLVHKEEPYAMILLKQLRDSHCHYCLNDLPADKVPCKSCSISLYCSQKCQIRAGGNMLKPNSEDSKSLHHLPSDLKNHISEITLTNDSEVEMEHVPEHKHECQGVNWPVVLPSELVLTGRVIARSISEKQVSTDKISLLRPLELSHCYVQMPSESKLELHIYSIVMLYCLQHSFGFELPLNGSLISQIVILISQIRVNCMTVTHIRSIDAHGTLDWFENFQPSGNALTSNVEQVRVGKAIYRGGSLFNHSCKPNIHAYYLSRTLYIRTTQFISAGSPLELSYGPQVGQWDCKDRLKFLKEEYYFQCQCSGCSEINLSDLVLNAFHCINPNCSGIVLESSVANCEKQKIKDLRNHAKINCLDSLIRTVDYNNGAPGKKARRPFNGSDNLHLLQHGYCLQCGSYCDIASSRAAVDEACVGIKRLQDAASKEVSGMEISNAMRFLSALKSNLHPYNKSNAEAEDSIAQALCSLGQLEQAMVHCKASIEILKKLFAPDDIVIAYELVKLASIQLSLGDTAVVDSMSQMLDIFSRYYGPHTDIVFPYLQTLRRVSDKFLRTRDNIFIQDRLRDFSL